MEKYLGIDFGKSKIGLALGDNQIKVAVPLDIIENNNKAIEKIKNICSDQNIDAIIVGVPIGLRQEKGQQFQETVKFIDILKQEIATCKIIKENEVMSSKMAQKLIENSSKEDDVAAMVILQGYLDS